MSERLKEIEKLCVPSGNPTYRCFSESDKIWLIDRVKELEQREKQLTRALEEISMETNVYFGNIARKALKGEE